MSAPRGVELDKVVPLLDVRGEAAVVQHVEALLHLGLLGLKDDLLKNFLKWVIFFNKLLWENVHQLKKKTNRNCK